jgi:hemerythrin
MKYNFVEKELEKFIVHLNEIVDCLDNGCNEMKETTDVLVIINKLHFYSEEFFVNNELNYRSDSDALLFMKKKRTNFIQGVKQFQMRFLDGEEKALVGLKEYLQEWTSKHETSKNIA